MIIIKLHYIRPKVINKFYCQIKGSILSLSLSLFVESQTRGISCIYIIIGFNQLLLINSSKIRSMHALPHGVSNSDQKRQKIVSISDGRLNLPNRNWFEYFIQMFLVKQNPMQCISLYFKFSIIRAYTNQKKMLQRLNYPLNHSTPSTTTLFIPHTHTHLQKKKD